MPRSERAQSPSVPPSRTRTVACNLLLEAELLRVVGRLERAGVPCVVLKGLPLARRLRRGIGGRVIGDNDLLVRTEDARRACALLERDGYRPLPFLDLERRLRHTNQFLLHKERNGVRLIVEVHWNAFSVALFNVPEHVQWAHTERFLLRGSALTVFDPPLTLIHLAAHFAQHGFADLRILRELVGAWNAWAPEHERAAFALAASIGLRPALEYALRIAADSGWLGGAAPARISRRARALLWVLPAERLSDRPELETSYVRQLLPLLLADASAIPRSLRNKLFPPLDELASTYRRPIGNSLYPRYVSYLFRPVGRMLRGEHPS
jgi:hypothetical protein